MIPTRSFFSMVFLAPTACSSSLLKKNSSIHNLSTDCQDLPARARRLGTRGVKIPLALDALRGLYGRGAIMNDRHERVRHPRGISVLDNVAAVNDSGSSLLNQSLRPV